MKNINNINKYPCTYFNSSISKRSEGSNFNEYAKMNKVSSSDIKSNLKQSETFQEYIMGEAMQQTSLFQAILYLSKMDKLNHNKTILSDEQFNIVHSYFVEGKSFSKYQNGQNTNKQNRNIKNEKSQIQFKEILKNEIVKVQR